MFSKRFASMVLLWAAVCWAAVLITLMTERQNPFPGHALSGKSPVPVQGLDDNTSPGKPRLGGLVSPDLTEPVQCPLPTDQKKKNVGGKDGSGLCVFTSIEYAARWTNERSLFDLQAHMKKQDGGGWPEKVDQVMREFAPAVQYLQSTTGDLSLLRAALASGRQCSVTYNGHDPHYKGTIAHMVTLEHLSAHWACISDNNFPGENERVWMSPAEFNKRHNGSDKGWAVVLLHCGPPPAPTPR